MTELQHGFLLTQNSPEVRIHYVETNNRPHNPLVIFLHGFPEHWYSWRDYLQAVAKEGFHGVALDLRGYNDSSKPLEEEQYKLNRLVEDVRTVIKHFGTKTTFVVGHDWGGVITWELARKWPKMLSGIVVMNGPYLDAAKRNLRNDFWLSLKQGLRSWYIYFFQLPVFPEMAIKRGNLKVIETMFFTQVHEHKLLTQHDINIYKKALNQTGALKSALSYYRANASEWAQKKEKKIEVPALLLWGEHDSALEKDLNRDMEKFFPKGLTKRFYPHSSHWIHLEHPKEIQNELLYFFSIIRLRGHINTEAPPLSL